MLVKKTKNKPFYPQQPVLVCSTPCFVAVFHSDLEYIFLSKCGNLNKIKVYLFSFIKINIAHLNCIIQVSVNVFSPFLRSISFLETLTNN